MPEHNSPQSYKDQILPVFLSPILAEKLLRAGHIQDGTLRLPDRDARVIVKTMLPKMKRGKSEGND